GTITLEPYTSAVLIRNGAVTNVPPTTNAGPDKNITLPTSEVTFEGGGTDPDGNIVSYNWKQISGPSTANILSSNLAITKVNALMQGEYQFQLTVTDDKGGASSDNVTVLVNPS